MAEGIKPVSPHDIRRSAGQWMVDLGVPIELVSKFMRHADTRITETVYASVQPQNVVDRILQAIDPRYTQSAQHRGKAPEVPTLKSLPAPRSHPVYEVAGTRKTLTEWSPESGIAKATLHHRVTRGLTMTQALSIGQSTHRRGRYAGIPGANAYECAVTPV